MKLQELVNRNVRDLLDVNQKKHIWGPSDHHGFGGPSLEHELKKFEIVFNCLRDGLTVAVEPRLRNGRRPDVLVLDLENPVAYEVMKSEKDSSIEEKKEEYLGIKIIEVRI